MTTGAPSGATSYRRFLKPGLFVGLLFALLYGRMPTPQSTSPDQRKTVTGEAFGTTYTVRYRGEASEQEVQTVMQAVVFRINGSMSTYHPDSELSRWNQGASIKASKDLILVMEEAKRIFNETGGAFDPTVGPLVDAWGFGPKMVVDPPTEAALKEAFASVGFSKVSIEEGRVERATPSVRVDLSAIAKGYAVEVASQALLSKLGLSDHLVEIGGEIQTMGGPWSAGIEKPQVKRQKEVLVTIDLSNRALATSGNYRNFVTVEGKRVTHILDPRSGEPVSHGLGSVSVTHARCTTADALATALYVLGEKEGLAWAEQHGVAALFVTQDGDATREVASSHWRKEQS